MRCKRTSCVITLGTQMITNQRDALLLRREKIDAELELLSTWRRLLGQDLKELERQLLDTKDAVDLSLAALDSRTEQRRAAAG